MMNKLGTTLKAGASEKSFARIPFLLSVYVMLAVRSGDFAKIPLFIGCTLLAVVIATYSMGSIKLSYPEKLPIWKRKLNDMSKFGAATPFHFMIYMIKELAVLQYRRVFPK